MTSLPDTDQSASREECTAGHDSNSRTPPSSVHEHDNTSELGFTSDQKCVLTSPATEPTSHQPSEGSEVTTLSGLYDGGTFDNASSVTLQDEFPWHEVGVNKCTQRIPSTIVPALLQGISNASPSSRSSLDRAEGKSCEVDEDSSELGDVPAYSTTQKGKWKSGTDDDVGQRDRSPSPQSRFNSIYNSAEDWVIHNRPILQDYANRQTSLPLGRRLEVLIDEPSKFILGSLQLLVNRDRSGCTDRTRQLSPQLVENFVDIDRWAKEYFRSRHGTQDVGSDVSTLLTIVMNNFYEGQVQLIDRLVKFALENMRFSGRTSLGLEDFAFGFDFNMSQDLPFYVETHSRIREPLPIRAVEVQSTSESVTTLSGRQVKPTKRAQETSQQAQTSASGRRNKGKNTPKAKDKQTPKGPVLPARQKKGPAQPSSNRTAREIPLVVQAETHVVAPTSPETTSKHTKHRPTRPSNLGLTPILVGSSSTSDNTPSQPNESSMSIPSDSASADSPKASGSSESNPTVNPTSRLKIVLPALKFSASKVSGSASSNTNSSVSQMTTSANALETTKRGRGRPRGTRPRDPRNRRGRGSPTVEILESTPDSTQTVQLVGARNAVASAAVNPAVVPPTHDALRSAGDTSCREEPLGVDNSIGARNDSPTSRSMRKAQHLLPLSDPGHLQGKKRKLDDCED